MTLVVVSCASVQMALSMNLRGHLSAWHAHHTLYHPRATMAASLRPAYSLALRRASLAACRSTASISARPHIRTSHRSTATVNHTTRSYRSLGEVVCNCVSKRRRADASALRHSFAVHHHRCHHPRFRYLLFHQLHLRHPPIRLHRCRHHQCHLRQRHHRLLPRHQTVRLPRARRHCRRRHRHQYPCRHHRLMVR